MTEDKGILIRNIYVMLSYAFKELSLNNYDYIKEEDFDNILDLLSEILYKGISKQLKQGLYREYISLEESIPTIKGKINMTGTIRNIVNQKKRICCEFDELSENNIFNQILKTTAFLLINDHSVKKARKAQLKKVMPFFNNVELVKPTEILWKQLKFQRNNSSYRMLMNICFFILDGLLMTTDSGDYRMAVFTDKYMDKLFEHFVLEYYKKHHKSLKANADRIPWDISNEEEAVITLLPEMQSDIVLHKDKRVLIIDTKYYSKSIIQNMGKDMIRSGNMYQIFSYVKNRDVHNTGDVSGMLLYAKTEEEITANLDADFGKNHISVRTLDLNVKYDDLFKQLDLIADSF